MCHLGTNAIFDALIMHHLVLVIITPHPCARCKVISSVVVRHCRCHKRCWTECFMPSNSRKSRKCLLGWPTSTTNCMFSLAMPINHIYHWYVVFPLCMLDSKGRRVVGHRVIKSTSKHYTELQLTHITTQG